MQTQTQKTTEQIRLNADRNRKSEIGNLKSETRTTTTENISYSQTHSHTYIL